jgi:hypothetical protein
MRHTVDRPYTQHNRKGHLDAKITNKGRLRIYIQKFHMHNLSKQTEHLNNNHITKTPIFYTVITQN